MGFSFRKSIKLAPGIRLNLSRKGLSTSVGVRGLTVNSRGRITASLPGTGVRFTKNMKSPESFLRHRAASSYEDGPSNSIRVQQNERFHDHLVSRTNNAIQSYFFSHGISVSPIDFEDAWKIGQHALLYEEIDSELSIIREVVSLIEDIGGVGIATKEKAMKAVYSVEIYLGEAHGEITGIVDALESVRDAYDSIPERPSYLVYFILCAAALVAGYFEFDLVAVALFLLASAGLVRFMFYRNDANAAANAIDVAVDAYRRTVVIELTPLADMVFC